MEPLPEPSRSRSKRDYEEAGESRADYEDDPERRKSRSSKSRKHTSSYPDEAEGHGEGRHRSSRRDDHAEGHDSSRRESSSSYRRSSQDSRKSPEEEWDLPGGRGKERSKEREESSRRERTYDSRVSKSRSDGDQRDLKSESAADKSKDQAREEVEEARSDAATPTERSGRYYGETDERDRGYSDSDTERNASAKDKEHDEVYKGRERERGGAWNERSRGDQDGSRDYWRTRGQGGRQDGPQERMDSASGGIGIQSRGGGYRKDSRGVRSDGGKGSMSGFGNRNDSSDSIEIRPVRNLDFARDGSELDGNDSSADQRGRMQRAGMNPNQPGSGQGIGSPLSSGSGPFGPKGGGRGIRGGRGRLNGRDNTPQRMGVPNLQIPLMGPPFSPLGLPPGPIQPIGPNIGANLGPNLSQPGPPIGPGMFLPPFPGPLVWPGGRGIDVNLLSAAPPNLPPIPPSVANAPRFGSNVAPSPSHSMHLNQPGAGRATQNVPGPGPMATPNREMTPHDKPSNTWMPPRNSGGPMGKAPSRGEQNDYSQNFVDTGMRPQNFIRELELTSVVEDYPKLRELIQRKDEIVANSASPPMYYKCDLREHVLSPEFFGTKFDVILVDPPWEEYVHRAPGITDHIEYWTFDEIMNLKIEAIADTPSFIFLWVGDGVGLEQGRACLKKWGFRRCEDICWVKTNKKNAGGVSLRHDSHTLFQHSKEHCLMGIKGTVRRSTDGHIIHANIDTDIIIAEEPTDGSTKKPEDMYRIIEHFSLGKRRLELFGEDHNIRPGWLTLGKGLSSSNYNKEAHIKNFSDKDGKVWQGGGGRNPPPEAPHLVVTTPEIEALRPKSPPQKNQQQQPMPPLGLGNSGNNRRNSSNSPQNSLAIMGPETTTPAHWNSSPMVGFGLADPGLVGPEGSGIYDGFRFGMPFAKGGGEHPDFDHHRMAHLL
ncbi:N6-adenosine-methyltransferase subunit METTL14 [Rhynchospora pubera]|uniref:N6-adenosine-methyltransferase subunit METTL14 n=1 Tax=Rhynchospora pubera TaxID=906938 RepID=A0AAV8DPH9_9POAL|nr:N6-adenosine-methyltransferase subunit METTL14 [Rhynchospora pubera]KAJ4769116.1 N6-adenosine-methyltransferase subunit METTL14 [Rhynchospora pubera]